MFSGVGIFQKHRPLEYTRKKIQVRRRRTRFNNLNASYTEGSSQSQQGLQDSSLDNSFLLNNTIGGEIPVAGFVDNPVATGRVRDSFLGEGEGSGSRRLIGTISAVPPNTLVSAKEEQGEILGNDLCPLPSILSNTVL